MRLVSLSYVRSTQFHNPASWLERIQPYVKVMELVARNHHVCCIEQIDYEGEMNLNGVQYFFIRNRNRKFPLGLHRLVKKLQPDVVIVHGLNFPAQVMQLRMKLGKKAVILVQSHADKFPSGWRKWLQKMADRVIDGYLFTSLEMANHWIRKKLISDAGKIKEVMVAASLFTIMDKKEAITLTKISGTPAFLFVGRLDANKDPYTLIKGFSFFAERHPTATLHMIFQDSHLPRELVKIINESPARNAIHPMGRIPHAEMQSWFSSADFIISASHAEAFGMGVSEAMSCGCFPIVTNIPAFRKLTNHGECGILFEPGNAEQLSASLEKAIHIDLEREKNKVIEHYKNHLSAEAIAEQIYRAVTSL